MGRILKLLPQCSHDEDAGRAGEEERKEGGPTATCSAFAARAETLTPKGGTEDGGKGEIERESCLMSD